MKAVAENENNFNLKNVPVQFTSIQNSSLKKIFMCPYHF